jgi:hypothetical protein
MDYLDRLDSGEPFRKMLAEFNLRGPFGLVFPSRTFRPVSTIRSTT